MSPLQATAILSPLKKLASTLASKVASAFATTSGDGTLPTNTQLLKMGPQSSFSRGSPHRHGW